MHTYVLCSLCIMTERGCEKNAGAKQQLDKKRCDTTDTQTCIVLDVRKDRNIYCTTVKNMRDHVDKISHQEKDKH